jgi:hypothetical protein
MFRRTRLETIQPGGEFEPRQPGIVRTTARVLTVSPDSRGIPHVKFELAVAPPSGPKVQSGTRTLSLERFADLYPVAI